SCRESQASPADQQIQDTRSCANPGNPVFSCMVTPAVKDTLSGLLYKTTSRDYGLLPSTSLSSQGTLHPMSRRFTEDLARSGMYRNTSFNTALDRSRVYDCPNLQHTT
uniref:Uncharacterized protein n=1 Tax=Sphaeramia orbicularis TaxID=375764 RepID=A0A672Y462_9TELE